MSSAPPAALAALYVWGAGTSGGLVSCTGKRKAPGSSPSPPRRQQHLPSPMSAGSLQPTRVAAWDSRILITSSHATTYAVELTYPEDQQPLEAGRCEGVSRHLSVKEGRVAALPPAGSGRGPQTAAEIQSIAFQEPAQLAAPVLGTVDSRGVVTLRRLQLGGEATHGIVEVRSAQVIAPPASPATVSFPRCGWSGLSFHPSDASMLGTARAFSRLVDFRDCEAGAVVRSCQLWHEPSGLAFLRAGPGASTSPVLAVAESQVLSLWDARASEGGGCVGREASAIRQHAWAVSAMPQDSSAVLLTTKDGSFLIFDLRAMRVRAQLRSPAKHDLLGLVMSAAEPHRVYGCGLDNEVLAASLAGAVSKESGARAKDSSSSIESKSAAAASSSTTPRPRTSHAPLPLGNRLHQTHTKGLRADSRWAGLSLPVVREDDGVDDLLGVSVTGTVYAIRRANLMSVALCKGGSSGGRPGEEGE